VTLLGLYHRGKTERAPVQALVLAAGRGQRFGGGKLHALYRDRPLLAHVLTVVEAACNHGLIRGGHVVIGADDERASGLVRDAGLEPIVNDAPELGLSNSLRLGLASLETESMVDPGAALVFLGDQPLVRLDVVEQLVKAWQEGRGAIIRPRYTGPGDVPGHPVVISRKVWPLASQLTGDLGFRVLVDSSSPDMVMLDVAGDNPDVDTWADLQALEKTRR
jgi:molybdenum cofactor cytidylyltransferase